MKAVGAALDHLIELAAVRVTKFRAKYVLENGECLHGIIRHNKRWASNTFVVVIDSINGKAVVAWSLAANGRA